MRYGLLGEKLSHSFSPEIHRRLWGAEYGLFPMGETDARRFLQSDAFDGLNVTIPYKRLAMELCDETDEIARRIGAVNTVIRRDGRLCGWNTDYYGMIAALESAHISLQNKKVLIFGSGGTSLTAQAAARDLGAKSIAVISRSGEDNYENLFERHGDGEVLINTTPVGMYPSCEAAIVDLRRFPNCSGVMDVVYNPLKTRLLQQAEELKIPAVGGLLMLVEQARRSAEIFAGRTISPEKAAECYSGMLRQNRNLVLIGMPGSGKTTLGRMLSERLDMPLADSDHEISRKSGKSPEAWITERGEEAFRDAEAEVIRDLGCRHGLILSVGGGAVLREENRNNLRQNGLICYVDRPLSLLAREGRPLSGNEKAIENLFTKRRPVYEALADFRCENNISLEDAVNRIAEAWLK